MSDPLGASLPSHLPPHLLLPIAASVGLSLVPGGKYALYPFRVFTTWVHECCHAGMAVLLGGSVKQINLAPDTSGVTRYTLPGGRLRLALVTSAGYPGASLIGCALYALSRTTSVSHAGVALIGLAFCLAMSLLIWVRGPFGMTAVAALAAGFFGASRLGSAAHAAWALELLSFTAIQTSLGALLDTRELFRLQPGRPGSPRSDAEQMRALAWLPAGFWALAWLALSLALTYLTLVRFTA